jgi:hypothetical protein
LHAAAILKEEVDRSGHGAGSFEPNLGADFGLFNAGGPVDLTAPDNLIQ